MFMGYLHVKRCIDFILSVLGLMFLWPIFVVLAVVIKLDSKGPVLFRQKRVCANKKYFYILKFRTMRIDTPEETPTHMLNNPSQWITKSGEFLRKTSLDELPQIINILKGEMSIVGPRPALWNQFDLIDSRDQFGVNDIPPGLTGWAQINGRDELSLKEKVKLDAEYRANLGFIMDVKCFVKTVSKVLKRDGYFEGGLENTDADKT